MNRDIFENLFVLELANNHWGNVDRGLKIINTYGQIVRFNNVRAAIKLQFRDVDEFVHPAWRDRTDVYKYTEGTLNVDLVDAKQNRLVWTGVAVGRVGRTKPEERGAKIDAAVAEIFLRYPYRAGSGMPVATP